MTSAEIEKIIIETLTELQAGSGDTPCEISSQTSPLTDLTFFDSLLAIETTVALEERLKCSCGEDSVFVDKTSDKALTVSEIAERLAQASKAAA